MNQNDPHAGATLATRCRCSPDCLVYVRGPQSIKFFAKGTHKSWRLASDDDVLAIGQDRVARPVCEREQAQQKRMGYVACVSDNKWMRQGHSRGRRWLCRMATH